MRLFELAYAVSRVILVSGLVCSGGVAVADGAKPGEPRPLKLEVIDQVIEANDRAVQSCNKGGRADTRAVLMQLTIDAEGKVSAVDPVLNAGDRLAPEASCLTRLSKRLRFPATGTISQVQYPFMIMPRFTREPSF